MRRFDGAHFRGREALKKTFTEKAMLKEEAAQRLVGNILTFLKGLPIETNSLENEIHEEEFRQFLIAKGKI